MSKDAIMQYVVAEAASETGTSEGFKLLREEALAKKGEGQGLDDWLSGCEVDERQFMEEHFGNDPDAKFKTSGEWKFRTYLPPRYYKAKKAIEGAWRNELDFDGMGKTAMEKASAKINRREPTVAERLAKTIRWLNECYDADAAETIQAVKGFLATKGE